MEKLSGEIRRRKMDVFGKQALPSAGCEAASVAVSKRSALSLRGIKFFDAQPGEPPKGTWYLDVLGGSSGIKETA